MRSLDSTIHDGSNGTDYQRGTDEFKHVADLVMTTLLTSLLFFWIDLRTPRVPLIAGSNSSLGSSAFIWNGEAV